MSFDTIALYGGIAAAAAAGIAALILFFVFRAKKERINAQMDKEYGEDP